MKKTLLILIFAFPFFVFAQKDSLSSGVYSWKEPVKKNSKIISSAVLFEGSTYDMEWLQMSANTITSSKTKITVKAPTDQEQLLIIKSGTLKVARDSVYSLIAGGVGLFMPGETYTLQNSGEQTCTFYLMKYHSKSPVDIARGATSGGSLIKDWSNIEFKPHDKGGRRDFFERPTAMCKRFEMHVTTLKEGLKSHDPHTHRAAEIIIVIDGNTEMQIGDKLYKGKKGSVYYLGSNILHGIRNDAVGDCSYFAFQFE
jgi:(S)-ureidoglycine aminohydrolase